MRLAAFGSLFTALLLVLALAVPLPFGPTAVVGGQAPPRDMDPICLALSYDATEDARELPTSVQLRAEPAWGREWYRAIGGPDPYRLYHAAWWRPAGPDSIDIGWHHSPILRLPSRADSVIGRGIPAYVLPLVVFMLSDAREFPVHARRVSCKPGVALPQSAPIWLPHGASSSAKA